jgi:hypothetical protein
VDCPTFIKDASPHKILLVLLLLHRCHRPRLAAIGVALAHYCFLLPKIVVWVHKSGFPPLLEKSETVHVGAFYKNGTTLGYELTDYKPMEIPPTNTSS